MRTSIYSIIKIEICGISVFAETIMKIKKKYIVVSPLFLTDCLLFDSRNISFFYIDDDFYAFQSNTNLKAIIHMSFIKISI